MKHALLGTAFVSALLLGCGAADSVAPDPFVPLPPPPAPGAAALRIMAGEDQTGPVGVELAQAIVVQVTAGAGLAADPIAGQVVNFVVVSGGGSVFAGAATSNELGEARERWTLGPTAGAQVLEARAVDQTTGDPIVFARITATAVPGAVATLTLSATTVRRFLGESIDLRTLVTHAADQFGNAIVAPTLAVTSDFPVAGTVLTADVERVGSALVSAGSASTSVEIRSEFDLRSTSFSFAYSCQAMSGGSTDSGMVIESIDVAGVVDSVLYGEQIQSIPQAWVTMQITAHGPGGETEAWESINPRPFTGFTLTSTAPRAYTGGNWCPANSAAPGAVTLQEVL